MLSLAWQKGLEYLTMYDDILYIFEVMFWHFMCYDVLKFSAKFSYNNVMNDNNGLV